MKSTVYSAAIQTFPFCLLTRLKQAGEERRTHFPKPACLYHSPRHSHRQQKHLGAVSGSIVFQFSTANNLLCLALLCFYNNWLQHQHKRQAHFTTSKLSYSEEKVSFSEYFCYCCKLQTPHCGSAWYGMTTTKSKPNRLIKIYHRLGAIKNSLTFILTFYL